TRDPDTKEPPSAPDPAIPPLLQKLIKQQADTGLPPAYLPWTSGLTVKGTRPDQPATRALWPQVEPFCSRRSRRGSPCLSAHAILLLAGGAARGRGRICAHHRCARNRQVGDPAPPRRATWEPA